MSPSVIRPMPWSHTRLWFCAHSSASLSLPLNLAIIAFFISCSHSPSRFSTFLKPGPQLAHIIGNNEDQRIAKRMTSHTFSSPVNVQLCAAYISHSASGALGSRRNISASESNVRVADVGIQRASNEVIAVFEGLLSVSILSPMEIEIDTRCWGWDVVERT